MHKNEPLWKSALPREWISPNEVHVWRVALDLTAVQIEAMSGLLSADEVARAGRFRFEKDQKRFITTRGMLRKLLGSYLCQAPDKLQFTYGDHGKPALESTLGDNDLCFNLSHAGDYALFAIARGRSIGIDIEQIRHAIAVRQIAGRFFAEREIHSLERSQEDQRRDLFFQYWTRKEAILKASGLGISFPMEKLDVSFMSDKTQTPILLPDNNCENACWYVQDLFPGSGYAASIALDRADYDLLCWHYTV